MKKLILIGISAVFSGVLMAQSVAPTSKVNQGGGVIVNQRGDIKEVSPEGSKTAIRNGKGVFSSVKEMRERRHHRHHRHHHRHHQNNQTRQHPAHNRVHR
jgi:hypothetical protein